MTPSFHALKRELFCIIQSKKEQKYSADVTCATSGVN